MSRMVNVIIATLPCFWDITHFTVGIESTTGTQNANQTQEITSEQYRELVIQGINRWNTVLQRDYDDNLYPNISNINFKILDGPTEEADINVRWWEFNESNGRADTEPNTGIIKNHATVFIAKHKIDGIWHNAAQISSITAHEVGHVLGLEHIKQWSQNPFTNDLMITGTQIQPDPNRRISSLDLQVINEMFGTTTVQERGNIPQTFIIPETEWPQLG